MLEIYIWKHSFNQPFIRRIHWQTLNWQNNNSPPNIFIFSQCKFLFCQFNTHQHIPLRKVWLKRILKEEGFIFISPYMFCGVKLLLYIYIYQIIYPCFKGEGKNKKKSAMKKKTTNANETKCPNSGMIRVTGCVGAYLPGGVVWATELSADNLCAHHIQQVFFFPAFIYKWHISNAP